MKILFVTYHHLDSNSGIHILNLANQLTRLGALCVVCVPNHKELTARAGDALFETVELFDVQQGRIRRDFDLIHAWTPREAVRKLTYSMLAIRPCPYIVHLEDNEDYLTESFLGVSADILRYVPGGILDFFVPPAISHPQRHRDFLSKAAGMTIIVDSLREFCPPGIPVQVTWAGYQTEMNWASPPDFEYKRRLGIGESEFILVYTGNVHTANSGEVSDLYRAVEIVNERGVPLRLIRTGVDHAPLPLRNLKTIRTKYCVELGQIPRSNLPSLLSIADILVQPGKPGRFNDYRFPSKLPEYLASGKPVILPKTNIGLHLRDREECLLLERGDAYDISEKIEILLSNADLRNRIGEGGRIFAERNLQWHDIAARLYDFYKSILKL